MAEFERDRVLEQLNQVLLGGFVPFNTALGMVGVDCGPGSATLKLPYAEHIVGNPNTGVIHGGAITALLDATCGLSVFLKMASMRRIATLDLRIDYMGPATPNKDVLARADCYKLTRSVAFVRAVAYHEHPADPVATAAGTFILIDEGDSPFAQALRGTP